MSRDDQGTALINFLANVALFAFALLLYNATSYYQQFLLPQSLRTLHILFSAYLIFGLPFMLLAPSGTRSKGMHIYHLMQRVLKDGRRMLMRFPLDTSVTFRVPKEERTALLFVIVKFFFLPIMLNFVVENLSGLEGHIANIRAGGDIHTLLLNAWFPLFLSALFLIDTAYFTFGYVVEHPVLKNTVRSVDTTLLGWVVALVCYPPFNAVPGYYIGWTANDFATFDGLFGTYLLRIATLFFLLIYVWATVALGAKCSNLTNRGIVSHGPYRFVRHPAYIAKNLGWWLTSIPFVVATGQIWLTVFSMGAWSVIYFLRALTEERHLIADPEYQAYCRKVRWRFIPYLL